MFKDVGEFHTKVLNFIPPEVPILGTPNWLTERYKFLLEESTEFYTDAMQGDLTKAVDGLLDTVYVALGTLWQMGVPADECWKLVQEANMKKVRGVTSRGNVLDAAKPEGWVGPEQGIARLLNVAPHN